MNTVKLAQIQNLKELIDAQDKMIQAQKDLIAALKTTLEVQEKPALKVAK